MQGFNYIQKDFVPRVDLQTLGSTFNTLEQGHQAAIKASSDLETAVANLDMNEAEDGFKEQLISEIRNTIDSNTIYGNSYAALDNLVAQTGDIASDGRILGRLRNQRAKKEYDAKVDAMRIPDGMKEMYKEENPYYYKDGEIDKRTGRIKPGEKWQANTKPVTTIPQSEIAKYALSIAAKEAGGGDSVTFLDANGRPTSDPTKSATGEIYKQVSGKFERLSKDKIRKAYREAIQAIPGAEDSLKQDYRYLNYEHDKLAKNGDNPAPYMQGVTDKNGNIYTYDQWLNNRIEGLADVAAYNHSYSQTHYGTALQSHKARQQTGLSLSIDPNAPTKGGAGAFILGTKDVEGNVFAGLQDAKTAANRQGLLILKKVASDKIKGMDSISDVLRNLMSNKKATGPGSAANYLIKTYGKNMSAQDKNQLYSAIMGYYQSERQMKPLLKAAGKDADLLRFSADVNSGIFKPDNFYSRQIIAELNKIYANNGTYECEVGQDVMPAILSKYKVSTAAELRNYGINVTQNADGNYNVEITGDNRYSLPRWSAIVHEADENTSGSIGGWFKKKLRIGAGRGNVLEKISNVKQVVGNVFGSALINTISNSLFTAGNPVVAAQNMMVSRDGGINSPTAVSDNLRNIYNNAINKSAKIESKVGLTKGKRTINANDAQSYAELYYRLNPGDMSESELQAKIKRANEQVDIACANGNFDSGLIEEFDATGNATHNINDAQDIKTLLQTMYSNDTYRKQISRSITVPSGTTAGQPKGYAHSFTVPKGVNIGKYKEGTKVKFATYGINNEEKNFDPSFNPEVLAKNAIQTSYATNSPIQNFGYSSNLGSTVLIPKGRGQFQSSFMGKHKIMNESEAESFSANLYALEQVKPRYLDAVNNYIYAQDANTQNYYYQQLQLIDNSLKQIAAGLSAVTGKDINSVGYGITNYIKSEE